MLSHLKTYFTHKQSLAVGLAFWSMGFLFGNWATLIPTIKLKFDLNDAQLGLLLLSMPVGSVLFNAVAAALIHRFGMSKTHFFSFVALSLAYMLPLSMPTLPLLSASLVLVGMCISLLNVAMNTCASAIEINSRRTIMSTSHGMFSLGLMSGSLGSGMMLAMGTTPRISMYIMCGLTLLLAFVSRPVIQTIQEVDTDSSSGQTARFVWPTGMFLMLVLISLCSNITEGSMADWSAVYLRDVVQTTPFFMGWGLAGYSFFMAVGRFLGDGIIPLYGYNKIMVFGGILVVFGLIIALALPYTFTAVAGFSLVGAGVSCASPILYGSSTRVPGVSAGGGLATLNTFGMGGFLLGPVLIGFISERFSLSFALGLIAVLAMTWVILARKTKFY